METPFEEDHLVTITETTMIKANIATTKDKSFFPFNLFLVRLEPNCLNNGTIVLSLFTKTLFGFLSSIIVTSAP